jgi:ABC-type nitrate/sulfonate/bicarbonate transport system permease component
LAQTFFYVAAGIAALLVGAGVFWAAWQVVATIKVVRQTLLPQVELTLTEVQKNLNNIDELTQDVDSTVGEATQLVHTANVAVAKVGSGVQTFNKRVAVPVMIQAASLMEGVKAGVKKLRTKSETEPQRPIIVIQEPLVVRPDVVEATNI